MLIGFNLPLSGPTASPAMLARLAAEGEAIGYDYAAISDHIVEPTDIHARYPYTESGEFPADGAAAIIEHALDFDGRYGVHTSPRAAARMPANTSSSNCRRGGTPSVPSGQDR